MEPERDSRYAEYLLSDGQRESLIEDSSLGWRETKEAEEIRERASNLDLRIQYLIEDIELLSRARVLEALDWWEIKPELEEIDVPMDDRIDFPMLEREREHPDGVNVSSFGLRIGHMLSQIYPGDRTEQTRLWWGLALGYFGHPARHTPRPYANLKIGGLPPSTSQEEEAESGEVSAGPPQSVLATVLKKFNNPDDDGVSRFKRANVRARRTLNRFGQILFDEFLDQTDFEDVTDLPLDVQAAIVATFEGELSEQSLTDAYCRYFRDIEESSEVDETITTLIEEAFPVDTDVAVERITSHHVDLELLEELDKLCLHQLGDRELIETHEGRGVSARDVFELLWNADEPLYANEVNKKIQKGANNVKWMLNEFADQGESRSDKQWGCSPPVVEKSDGFELNQYCKLLCILHFESERPYTELYALAFSGGIRSAFDIDERVPVLVNGLVESEVETRCST